MISGLSPNLAQTVHHLLAVDLLRRGCLADGGGNGGIPEPDGGSTGNGGGGFTFSPTVTVQITVEGNADSEALEEMRAQLMAEFETKMRELYDEFREEDLQRAALKNQYAF